MDIQGNVLLAGCGGGYDIFTGLPLYLELIDNGYTCYLASFSTSDKVESKNFQKLGHFHVVEPQEPDNKYEILSSEQLLANNLKVKIYTYIDYNMSTLISSYQILVEELDIKTIILVDGGCDSIMTGKEKNLGSPLEDFMSLYAVNYLKDTQIYLQIVGADVDWYDFRNEDGIFEDDYYNALNQLPIVLKGNYFDNFTVGDEKQKMYIKKYMDIFFSSEPERSLVNSCICASIQGINGWYRPDWIIHRYGVRKFKIRKETSDYYIFNFKDVYERNCILPLLSAIDDWEQIDEKITAYQEELHGIIQN